MAPAGVVSMARMARSDSLRALEFRRPRRLVAERPAFRASVAQGAAWLSGSHHAAERDGYPKPVVAPRGHATSAVLARLYMLLQAYARLKFRPLGGWALKPGPLK